MFKRLLMWHLTRKWMKQIKANPSSEAVQQMAAQTGRIRDLQRYKEQSND